MTRAVAIGQVVQGDKEKPELTDMASLWGGSWRRARGRFCGRQGRSSGGRWLRFRRGGLAARLIDVEPAALRAVLRERAACGGSLLVKFSARPAVRGMHVFNMLLVTVEFGFVGVLLEVSIERRDSHRRSLERVDGVAAGHRARGKSHVCQFLVGHLIQPVLVLEVLLELCVGGQFEPAMCALDRHEPSGTNTSGTHTSVHVGDAIW
jgi:hypothetical protein